jgi:ethanolamine utilization microcompartment shell protein EutS
MRLNSCLLPGLVALALTAAGCAGQTAQRTPEIESPIQARSADLAVALMAIAGHGDEETLVQDPGWLEYVIEIENLSPNDLTVLNAKLLNRDGVYVDSASAYAQITAPPDAGAELAGDVAKRAAGMAVDQVIPFGGQILRVLSGAVSASSAEAKANTKRAFAMRVLKNVELAPAGKVARSAFLPNIARVKLLVVDYAQGGAAHRIEIPLPVQAP